MNTRMSVFWLTALWASIAAVISAARADSPYVPGSSAPPAVIEYVAHQGDPVPGIPDAYFASLSRPRIDGGGNVLFVAGLAGPGIDSTNDLAILYGPPGGLEIILREADQVPDMPAGVVVDNLYYSGDAVSETGWIQLTAQIAGPGIEPDFNDLVVLVGPPGDMRKVIQTGDQAPGCDLGVYVTAAGGFGGILSDNGTVRVDGSLAGPGVWVGNDRAMWIGTRDELALVFREGMQAPGCPAGVLLKTPDYISFNDQAQVSFRCTLAGEGVTYDNDMGRWVGAPGDLHLVAREGDPVPGMAEGVTWKGAGGSDTTNAWGVVYEGGPIQGPGVTSDNDMVVFVGQWDELVFCGREGDPVPEIGSGVTLGAVGSCLTNNRNEVFYQTSFIGPGITESNKWAMYFGPIAEGRLELRDGDSAPTFPAEVALWRVVGIPGNTAMNDIGGIVAPTLIDGPGVTAEDKVVLWYRHPILRRWVPLLRSGGSVLGRTVWAEDEYDFAHGFSTRTSGSDGWYQSFNDAGQLALGLAFTDGTEGVFRISPPVFGDGDEDGDVDLDDASLMHDCMQGPDDGMPADCDAFDLDLDDDVDLADHALFQQLFHGG